MKKTGVILSGCGFLDGSEIHEAVLTLLALDRAGIEAVALAPNILQHHVLNHRTGEVAQGEMRNVLDESARIARGAVTDLALFDTLNLDALILPGGYGAAKNLSDYAFKGAECNVNTDVTRAIHSFHQAGKPIGFICIAPMIAAKVLGEEHPLLTIGNDPSTAADLEAMGAKHIDCPVWNAIVWNKGKVVSTPAYMLGPSIAEVAKGIDQLVEELARLL
ncbi:MAG: isoprenoid biosynthesis glyoxalase ElbB [Candidatus Chlorobium antarcticum]|jgi:enhancing lycopene biosynthesis protein 2|nr:isoprenoid biosynthesis glyoxalase ElbB [Candidatus Chlorobium antarcticum]